MNSALAGGLIYIYHYRDPHHEEKKRRKKQSSSPARDARMIYSSNSFHLLSPSGHRNRHPFPPLGQRIYPSVLRKKLVEALPITKPRPSQKGVSASRRTTRIDRTNPDGDKADRVGLTASKTPWRSYPTAHNHEDGKDSRIIPALPIGLGAYEVHADFLQFLCTVHSPTTLSVLNPPSQPVSFKNSDFQSHATTKAALRRIPHSDFSTLVPPACPRRTPHRKKAQFRSKSSSSNPPFPVSPFRPFAVLSQIPRRGKPYPADRSWTIARPPCPLRPRPRPSLDRT